MLIGGAALLGIVLALLVVVLLASRRSDEPLSTPPVAEAAPEAMAKKPDVPEVPGAADQEPTPDAASDNAVPIVPPPLSPDPTANGESAAGVAQPTPESTAPSGTAAPKTDMVDAPVDPVTEPGDARPDATPTATAPSTDEPHAADMTDPSGRVAPEGVTNANAAPSDARDTASPTENAPADLSAQLSMTIVAIEFEGMPLVKFADFVAALTAIPVTLDLDALLVAQISPDTKLDVQERGVTVGQVLQSAIEPAGLKFVEDSGQIVIAPRVDSNQETSPQTYDVSDLASGEAQMQTLAQQVLALIAPLSWSEAGGAGTLSITDQSLEVEQTAATHFQLIRFLDRLRAVRGLLPRSELPEDLLDVTPAFVRASGELTAPMSVNFSEPTEVARILEYLRAQTDLRLLVDWQSALQVQWQPTTKSTLSGDGQTLTKLLDTWLEPLQLGYRVTDVHTIQIASAQSLASHGEVEIYPLKGNAESDGTALIQELKQHLGGSGLVDEGGIGIVLLDPESNSLLTRLPQPQQRRVAAWLTTADKLRVTTAARTP